MTKNLLLLTSIVQAGLIRDAVLIHSDDNQTERSDNGTVLVLSKYTKTWKNPISINYKGEHQDAIFDYGVDTDLYLSCSVQYKDAFYIFGGLFQPRQVSPCVPIDKYLINLY